RKSGGHRKHSDGGFSDASSGGSFLDETDREVSNLTDRAFRSLCIGDEAVYNDSDLSLSLPSTNSDRQLAFCRGSEERERDDRKRTAQDNFNVRVQQYGQDWITGGMYGAEIHRGPQWEACGERTQGMVSATFQHSLVETSQLGKSQMEEELSFLSNGATELSSQQRRSHSRVSSLTRAFDSDGHRDGVEMDHKIKERDDGTSWDKSALMSIQRELSEFSYQQNFNSHHFHRAGLLSSRDANFYSSEAETMAQISHSFMRSSQNKHSMSSQVNCSSNFFIHSEFSPFRLWRDYNRFPFQPAEAAGFMHYSEFPKWYHTPMYNELYLENQAHSHHRDFRHQKNHLGLPVPLTAPRSISTSSQLQRASAVEKRCESELTVHHPHRKWTQRLGTNKLPSHRPSTASPSTEMSRRVRDTISSVKALQQKVKMMSEHNMTNQQGVFSGNDSWVHLSNNALTVDTNIVSNNTVNPFRIGQVLTPSVHQHQDAETSHLHQHEVSSQPVEHPPVRAESRGATPDIRMSNYRSRATSLLFNLKDNRKRVKSTYSPTKFKGLDTATKNQQSSVHELHETVFTDSDMQCLQPEAHRRTNSAVNQYHTPALTTQTSAPVKVNTGQYPENTASNYQAAPMQGQMGYGSAFSGFVSSKYFNNQVAGNGQHLNKTLASFTPYRQDIYGSAEEVIVSEDKEIPQVQQFPPNKKEGFFPLIQTRRSRCPVFTEDPQDLSVKTQSLPNKTEIGSTAANKEPKLLVFPIMEKEHQRTGIPYRPAAAASPAPSLPRSNTSSPALGTKPLMFRVKDNTNRGSSFTKSVKPHFHKNFGEDFLMGLTLEGQSDKTEEDQEIIRRNAGTPLNRFSAISESATFLSPSSSQDYSNSIPHLRPYSRRSMAVDDDESHSVISNMSEDVESFATSAADLTDMHGLFDNDRPESVCSFSSDVSRSLGKPPTVPPKSEKALRRAQRLTSRRIKKELSKAATESPTGVKEVSIFPSSPSSSNEVCSSNHHAVASPHFSPPVAFALAPTVGSSMPSSHKDHKSSHCSLHASPHATGPISIPSSSPCAASAFSLHACSPASKPAVLQTVAHVSSSPTLHHVNHQATPVTQYHVESTNYPQSYPAMQRKVLQDLGSGQYFVVDVPVQVKTKTFFDPETGKYVQLNVRQTGQNISQPQLQQAYQQPKVQPQMQIKQQQPISSIVSGVSKPLRFYRNSHSPSQNYQTAVANSVHPSSSSIPATLHQNQQVLRENHSYGNPVPGVDQNSEGHRYSPEKTPYMDTVNDITKTYNLVNSPADACNPSLECDTNSQLSRSSVCENDLSANSECRPRDIIAISELEDFMEVCDW
ncbi:hypothetical protein XENOCAPTIV_000485, partial [Xenoophorus captivus]